MFANITVHPRVHKRHPSITDQDVVHACHHMIAVTERGYESDEDSYYAAVGRDSRGRMIELVGVQVDNDTVLVYHAMKVTEKMQRELGL